MLRFTFLARTVEIIRNPLHKYLGVSCASWAMKDGILLLLHLVHAAIMGDGLFMVMLLLMDFLQTSPYKACTVHLAKVLYVQLKIWQK
ncbi:hypothetical protein NL676_012639 [Syzygium grande]|nr:hypothetical protein NL676_012639 [Syzygium grande]